MNFKILGPLLLTLVTQISCSSKCSDGCLTTQGEKLSLSDAEQLVYYCDIFTRNGVGRMALRLSYDEVAQRTDSDLNHPLMMAFLTYEDLYKSPLVFYRADSAKDVDYMEIVRSCNQLKRDFHSDRKWTY